ncbi:MAG TPA: chemotaxis protein CheB, partial [Thermoanaerobaculia bacterium]|nr:chemotaxis protein CheB [Thermoanaerobaculia bacterium]
MTEPERPKSRKAPRGPKASAKRTAAPLPPDATPEGAVTDNPFPIVGIGASAGGLEALEEFLRHVPEASGLALVVVQHLDPTHKGVLAELLQRTTTMKVVQVRDRLRVKPDCVYVIPPNRDMSVLHGVLHLFEPTAPRGLRLPIDFFFRSLAVDRQERSVGVVLSGMGADGTLGLRAIKEAGGLVLVQEPSTAKFDSMPRSAIAAGVADVVAPIADLPGKILSYVRHVPLHGRSEPLLPDGERSALEKIAILLRAR